MERRAHAQSFSKLACDIAYIATPVCRQTAIRNIAMEAAMRPIDHPRNVSVFDWIEVDVVHVPREIGVIANDMLPMRPCHRPFSRFAILLGVRSASYDKPREKALLIKLHRDEKSASPVGRAQTACM